MTWTAVLNDLRLWSLLHAILLLILGYFCAYLSSSVVKNILAKYLSLHRTMLLRRAVFYLVLVMFIASAVQQLGFDIGTLLGAAGILTAAIGFASQTSMSNIISGIFILGEKPFEVGDTIRINNIEGEVVTVDLLSAKIRTPDNMLIRIPNEMLIKSPIINISYFHQGRIDLAIHIGLDEDIERVKNILLTLAEKNPLCLDIPKPEFQVVKFCDSAVELQFLIWADRKNATELKTTIQTEIKKAFAENNIRFPFPTRTVYLVSDKGN